MNAYKTTAVYLSGGICGDTWQPSAGVCGMPLQANLRGRWAYPHFDKGDSFRSWLLSLLCHKAGDFQSAQFTEDTVIRIERHANDGPGKYRVHVKELPIASLPGCTDLIRASTFTSDFMGDNE